MATAVRVVVCDDHRVFAEAVSRFLRGVDGIDVTATVATCDDAVRAAARGADVLLLDAQLGEECDGLDVVEAIRNRRLGVRVLLLSGGVSAAFVASAIEAGAAGYCTKDVDPARLAAYVTAVAAGETVLADEAAASVVYELARRRQLREEAVSRLGALTRRERQVLDGLAEGYTLTEVATRLGLSPSTLRTHLHHAFGKLGVSSQLEAAAVVRRYGELGRDAHAPAAG